MTTTTEKEWEEIFHKKFPRAGYLYAGFVEATNEMVEFIRETRQEAYEEGKRDQTRNLNKELFDILRENGREDMIEKVLEQTRNLPE